MPDYGDNRTGPNGPGGNVPLSDLVTKYKLIYFSFFTSFQASFCAFGCQQYSPKVRKRQSLLSVLFSKYLQLLCCKVLSLTEHVLITPVLHMFIGTMVSKWTYFFLTFCFNYNTNFSVCITERIRTEKSTMWQPTNRLNDKRSKVNFIRLPCTRLFLCHNVGYVKFLFTDHVRISCR